MPTSIRPREIAALGKSVAINCTGYGARALWKDETVTPVRGQIARLIPQPGVHYGLSYRHVYVVPRRDGIVVQDLAGGDMKGFGDSNEAIDRAEADACGDDPGRAVLAGALARRGAGRSGRKLLSFPRRGDAHLRAGAGIGMPPQLLLPWFDIPLPIISRRNGT